VIRTSKRKREARSPQQQRDMIEACSELKGYELVTTFDSGRDESGKTMDRASLNAAMAGVRSGDWDGLIFAITDRVGRAPIEESMAFIRSLDRVGYLVLADAGGEPVNLEDAQAETNLVLQLQMARQYWKATQARMQRSTRDAIKAGKYVAPTPLGFDRVDHRLVPNKDAKLMRKAFVAAGSGSVSAAGALLKGRWPEKRWDTDRVRKLLSSPAYKGWAASGRLVNREAHNPIVTEREWDLAQTTPKERRRNGCYPLSGIAVSEDGEPLVGQLQTVNGRQYRRMRTAQTARCSIGATELEDLVLGVLQQQLAKQGFRDRFVPGDIEAARHELGLVKARRTAYVTKMDPLDPDFEAGRDVHDRAIADAQKAYDEISGQAARFELLPSASDLDFERDEQGHPVDAEGFELALRLAVDRVVVRRGRGTVKDRVVDIVWCR
jgi:DNA invertase Pin-like site-specific DNA recombinase